MIVSTKALVDTIADERGKLRAEAIVGADGGGRRRRSGG
jgi:hypothetical protein